MWFNTLVLALRSIRRNLLRSFLTVLGIVIGVAAVITMVTVGNGATLASQRPDVLMSTANSAPASGSALAGVGRLPPPLWRLTPSPLPSKCRACWRRRPRPAPGPPSWPVAATGRAVSLAAPTSGW